MVANMSSLGILSFARKGPSIKPGNHVGLGKDYTIYSLIEGQVTFETKHGRKVVSVYPVEG